MLSLQSSGFSYSVELKSETQNRKRASQNSPQLSTGWRRPKWRANLGLFWPASSGFGKLVCLPPPYPKSDLGIVGLVN
jgi:hypothetical protein